MDIQSPINGVPAVENITFTNKSIMPSTDYEFFVHNFAKRGGASGFSAEIEFDGKIYNFEYPHDIPDNHSVPVATVTLKNGVFTIKEHLNSSKSVKTVWGVNTQQWTKVNMVMNSPNHWDGEETGNKHWFFILDNCANPEGTRGFYNEYLSSSFHEDRKVFELLASKMKTEESDNQLSGLGFSSTQRNSVLCKVGGSHTRVLKITF